ncbi:hypothetical protein ACVWXF_002467 [Thermostichus sp. MS-CIW-40]
MSAPPSQPSNPVRIETTRDLLEALREGRSLVGANLENAYLSRGLFDRIQLEIAGAPHCTRRVSAGRNAEVMIEP